MIDEHFKTNETPNEITVCLRRNTWVTWLKLLGANFSTDPGNESALTTANRLVKDRFKESGAIQGRYNYTRPQSHMYVAYVYAVYRPTSAVYVAIFISSLDPPQYSMVVIRFFC